MLGPVLFLIFINNLASPSPSLIVVVSSYRMIYAKHLTGQRNGMLLMSFFLMLLKPTYFSGSLANSHRFVPTITTREDTGYNLRERSYNLTLRQIDNNVHRKNFMYKMLFRHNYRVAQKAAIKNHH